MYYLQLLKLQNNFLCIFTSLKIFFYLRREFLNTVYITISAKKIKIHVREYMFNVHIVFKAQSTLYLSWSYTESMLE